MAKIIIIKGSSRKNGNTHKVVDTLLERLNATYIDLQDYQFSYYDYDHKNSEDDFLTIAEQMVQYDHLIFATPVYWYSMSAIMKTFFDRLSDLLTIRKDLGRALKGKTLSAIACSSDATAYEGFFMPFERTAEYLEMHWGGGIHTWVEGEEVPETVRIRLYKLYS